jgi:hypothetical protein
MAGEGVEVLGVFLQSFAGACVNLNILAGGEAERLVQVDPNAWYPAERFLAAMKTIDSRFDDAEPIKERLGAEMMRLWYEHGPGRSIVSRGVDFLRHQTGSQGYHGVTRGPATLVGNFSLAAIDAERGTARVVSTTPFDRTMERGVLLGGIRLAGDLVYVDVDNGADASVFEINFH